MNVVRGIDGPLEAAESIWAPKVRGWVEVGRYYAEAGLELALAAEFPAYFSRSIIHGVTSLDLLKVV